MSDNATAMTCPPPKRWKRWLTQRTREEQDWPEWAGKGDSVHVVTGFKFDWKGRLLIFLFGRLRVTTVTVAEHPLGRTSPLRVMTESGLLARHEGEK